MGKCFDVFLFVAAWEHFKRSPSERHAAKNGGFYPDEGDASASAFRNHQQGFQNFCPEASLSAQRCGARLVIAAFRGGGTGRFMRRRLCPAKFTSRSRQTSHMAPPPWSELLTYSLWTRTKGGGLSITNTTHFKLQSNSHYRSSCCSGGIYVNISPPPPRSATLRRHRAFSHDLQTN